MNYFKVGLNLNLKEKMSVRQYISYEDMCDTTVNVERAIKRKMSSTMSNRGIRGMGINEEITTPKTHIRTLGRTTLITTTNVIDNNLAIGLE